MKNAVDEAESYAKGKPWTRVIWDVTAVAWTQNHKERYMNETIITAPIPTYDNKYEPNVQGKLMKYIYSVDRDALFEELFSKLGE